MEWSMPHDNDNTPPAHCRSCGADWRGGEYAGDCPECGGGAMSRPCPLCGGACGQSWRRAVSDSTDSGVAHWIGACVLTDSAESTNALHSAGRVEWWLDGAALPGLSWALLVETAWGGVLVRDRDGADHAFADYAEAAEWLRENDYARLEDLRAEAGFKPAAPPPVAWLGKRFAADG